MCNVTHIVHIAQGVSVPVHELHTIFLSTHVWNGSICIFIGLCTCFWCGSLSDNASDSLRPPPQDSTASPYSFGPRQTSNLSLRQRSQAMSGCQTFRCLSSNWTNSSDSHSANTSYNTTLKNTLESKWTKTCKDEDKGKNLNTVKAQPCWLNENRAPTGESTLAIVERRSCQSYLSA